MKRLIVCDHPRGEDDLFSLRDDLHIVLNYAKAVFYGFECMVRGEPTLRQTDAEHLAALGGELCDEARRQVDLLYGAGELWKERAKANGPGAQGQRKGGVNGKAAS